VHHALIWAKANDVTDNGQLQAFIDGEMDAAEARDFSARLQGSPELAQLHALYSTDKASLSAAYKHMADLPIPPRHLAVLHRAKRSKSPQWFGGMALAASVALAAWFGAPLMIGDPLVGEAMAAYTGKTTPTGSLAVSEGTSEEQETQWLSAKITTSVHIPDLTPAGYTLSSISHYGKNAEIRYVSRDGKPFTIYLSRPSGRDRFDMQSRDALEICVWENQDMSVAMIGAMSAKEMLRIAAATYADLNL
jgi:anti-sigma factor RsiW